MISLSSIIYPLYRQKPRKFIVAGDPFQIEPIVAVEQWKDENIYTLVGLNKAGAFAKPATEPHDYLVTNLETQYRSIPAIGEIFSRFTYDGILKHHRTAETQRPLKLNNLDVQPIRPHQVSRQQIRKYLPSEAVGERNVLSDLLGAVHFRVCPVVCRTNTDRPCRQVPHRDHRPLSSSSKPVE